jgi:hypothetical protein
MLDNTIFLRLARDQAARNLGSAWAVSHLQDLPALAWQRMLLFYGSVRLRAPLEPFLVVLASGAIGWLVSRLPQLRRPQPERALALAHVIEQPASSGTDLR